MSNKNIEKSVFSEEGRKEYLTMLKEVNSSKESAIKFYCAVGIMTENGNLTDVYKFTEPQMVCK